MTLGHRLRLDRQARTAVPAVGRRRIFLVRPVVLLGYDREALARVALHAVIDIVAAGRQVSDLEREYAQVLGATDAEYHAFLDKVHAAEATNPLLKMVWPATEAIEDKTRAMIVQRAMTVAGLAVAQEGPGALAGYADPATGQPFQYQATPTGFELQSAYQQKGKPMALTFVKP